MKVVSEQELQLAYDHGVEGAIKGGAVATAGGLIVTGLLQKFSPTFRGLPVSVRASVVMIALIGGVSYGGERAILNYSRKYSRTTPEQTPRVEATLLKSIKQQRYYIVGGVWALSMVGAMAYSFSEPNLKLSQKIVHARMYAQFATIAALLGTAVLVQFDYTPKPQPAAREFDVPPEQMNK